jgi:energy-coupling factor transporter ATP-binding protein EcfA2
MVQQSNTAPLADETGRQRRDTARTDPTAPLCLGTATDTDDPVTLARTEPFAPILITAKTGAGKTTLAHHIADQQLHPNSGLCYVSKINPPITALFQRTPTTHECDSIALDGSWDPTTAVPDDIGTTPTIHGVRLDIDTDRNTTLLRALLGQIHQNRAEQTPTDHSYTIVLDGLAGFDWDQLALDTLLAEARTLNLHIVITTQGRTYVSKSGQRDLRSAVRTYITGPVTPAEARHIAAHDPTVTADELTALPRYQWCLHQPMADGQNVQFTSPPPQLSERDDHDQREQRGEL